MTIKEPPKNFTWAEKYEWHRKFTPDYAALDTAQLEKGLQSFFTQPLPENILAALRAGQAEPSGQSKGEGADPAPLTIGEYLNTTCAISSQRMQLGGDELPGSEGFFALARAMSSLAGDTPIDLSKEIDSRIINNLENLHTGLRYLQHAYRKHPTKRLTVDYIMERYTRTLEMHLGVSIIGEEQFKQPS